MKANSVDSSVSIVTWLRLEDRKKVIWFPGKGDGYFSLRKLETGSGVQLGSYLKGTRGSFSESEAAGS
jgi:hypothetical protein